LWFWSTKPTPREENKKPLPYVAGFYLTKSFFFFSFFLLSLFAPLNGIQQLEDTSDTQLLSGYFYLPFFVPYGHNFLCDTALPLWRFCLGTLALATGSLRPINWRDMFPPLPFIPS
jgi:hypothetical protein